MTSPRKSLLLLAMLAAAPAAAQQETTTYSYDALGRLVGSKSTKSGGTVQTDIEYDAAGNRKRYKVSGATSSNSPSAGQHNIVVVPLNGFTVIPIN